MEDDEKTSVPRKEEEPVIFGVSFNAGKRRFSRRGFVEAAATTVVAATLSSCTPPAKPEGDPTSVGNSNVTVQPTDTTEPSATLKPTNTPIPTRTYTPSPTATKTSSPTPSYTPTPVGVTATVLNQGARVRTGPGTNYPIMGSLAVRVVIIIVGRLADSSWYKVRVKLADLPNINTSALAEKDRSLGEVEGWMRSDQVDVKGQSLDDLPVDQPPPTATPLPNKPIEPGGQGIQYSYTDPYGNVQTFTLPCGSEIPEGAICTCNCVTVCSCDSYVAPADPPSGESGGCSNNTVCTCDAVHYWYPN